MCVCVCVWGGGGGGGGGACVCVCVESHITVTTQASLKSASQYLMSAVCVLGEYSEDILLFLNQSRSCWNSGTNVRQC